MERRETKAYLYMIYSSSLAQLYRGFERAGNNDDGIRTVRKNGIYKF